MKSILFTTLALTFSLSAFSQNLRNRVSDQAQETLRSARQLRNTVDNNINRPRRLKRMAERQMVQLEQDVRQLRRLIDRYAMTPVTPPAPTPAPVPLRFKWVQLPDQPARGCANTPQAGDGDPRIVSSPVVMGQVCNRFNVGATFCDAGRIGNRFLDRHWVCRQQ